MRLSKGVRFCLVLVVLVIGIITYLIAERVTPEAIEPPNLVKVDSELQAVDEACAEAIAHVLTNLDAYTEADLNYGEIAFLRAKQSLVEADHSAAKEYLEYVIKYFPATLSAPTARRILGDMNLDALFAPENLARLKQHTVARGDSFYKIVKDNQTNLDLLMYLNDLKRINQIHPGDSFSVMPLHFRLLIDLPNELVSIWNGAEWIKGYEIKYSNMATEADRKTILVGVEAHSDQGSIQLPNSNFRAADKALLIKSPKAQIRPYSVELGADFVGLGLDAPDVEELALLLRAGNSVEIRY
jgi:LysM repeat protein